MTQPAASPSPSSPAASTVPAPRRKAGFLRKLLRLVVVLLLLVGLSPLLLKVGFVRDLLARRVGDALGLPVTVAKASAWWTSGVDLEGLVVGSPPGFDGPLAQVERVHVEVGLLRLVRGNVDARVQVTRPVLMLRRNAAGALNIDGLRGGEERPKEPKASDGSSAGAQVQVEVVDGAFEAHGWGSRVERVSDIDWTAEVEASGAMKATLGALAEKAGVSGGDVRISIQGARTPDGESPITAEVPELDLARLAGLIEGLSGLRDIRGTTRLSARGALAADGSVKGRLVLGGEGFSARTAGGARVALGRVTGTIDVVQSAEGESATADLTLADVEVEDGEGAEARRLTEPSITSQFEARHGKDGVIDVRTLKVSAGQALSASTGGPLRLLPPAAGGAGPYRVEGQVTVQADLGRLAALKAFVPRLASLQSGQAVATLEGRPAEGLDVGLGARVVNLVLAAGDLAPDGHTERDVVLQARLVHGSDGASTLDLYRLSSSVATLDAAQPFQVRHARDGALSFAGTLKLAVMLEPLGRLLGGALGLAPGERLGGTLSAEGTATGTAEDGRLTLRLGGRGLRLPPSFGDAGREGDLAGQLQLEWSPSLLVAQVQGVRAFGTTLDGRAALQRGADGLRFDGAEGELGADLATVRGWFGARLGLAPGAALAGQVRSKVTLTSEAAGRRAAGSTQVANLSYRSAPGAAPLEEQALTLEHTLLLPREAGPVALEVLRLRTSALTADLSGSRLPQGEGGSLLLTGTVDGDAARLAERVRAVLGSEYRDLTGSGRVTGSLRLEGPAADALAGSTASADLRLGSWSAAGAALSDGRLRLQRAATSQPYALELDAGLNGGTAAVRLGLRPSGAALPWTLTTTLRAVDLSTLVLDHGAGRYLGYVLPTLVPMDKSTPVLSGRLEADLSLAAGDVADPALLDTVAGTGKVSLTQGTLGESTLFGAIAGGQGLGDVGAALGKVAPEVGRTLASFQRAVTFQSLLSRFRVGQRRLTLEETRLTGEALRLDMTGTVTFEQQADLAARLWLGSAAGSALKPVVPDQTIPLRIRGRLDKPQVLPDLKASDLLKGAVGDLLPKPADLLPGSGQDPTKKLEDEAKKLKDRFKGLLPGK